VSFEIVGPWTEASRMTPSELPVGQKIAGGILGSILVVLIGGGLFFARRNLRLGRGDRRGATRLAVFTLVVLAVPWMLTENHVTTFWELYLGVTFLSSAILQAGLIWVLYIALEPFVRRRWPHMLVSWTRVLSGEWHDPLVGRDVLVGCAAGVTMGCLYCLAVLAPSWFGYPEAIPLQQPIGGIETLAGFGSALSVLVSSVPLWGLSGAFGFLFLIFFLRALSRSEWVAAVALLILLTAGTMFGYEGPGGLLIFGLLHLAYNATFLFVLLRFGIVAAVLGNSVGFLLLVFPVTLQTSAWYAGIGYVALLVLAGLALYGFRTSLGGRPLLNIATVED